jgi:hypothetical protein
MKSRRANTNSHSLLRLFFLLLLLLLRQRLCFENKTQKNTVSMSVHFMHNVKRTAGAPTGGNATSHSLLRLLSFLLLLLLLR